MDCICVFFYSLRLGVVYVTDWSLLSHVPYIFMWLNTLLTIAYSHWKLDQSILSQCIIHCATDDALLLFRQPTPCNMLHLRGIILLYESQLAIHSSPSSSS